ncbi:MAG: hypothetical protein JXB88_27390, partial [Spirochaetales bacterium]|nr:hypothetical protein [Spirochaetales bacterium]
GSKSKFDTPGHIAMPPGVKFKKNPNNEGEVSSGVVSNVKINGKEAAVLGSMVKTCNDPQPQETCTIIAVGAPVVLPILMPGMDPDQFEKDGGTVFNNGEPVTTKAKTQQADKQPKLKNPKWNKDKAKVGEEVTLCVDCVDQYELANVTFTIWEEGADREKDAPVVVLKGQNVDGKAEVKTRFFKPEMDAEIDEIKYFFSAKSFRCDKVESSTIEIERIKPEFNDLKWLWIDNEEKEVEVTKAELGVLLYVSALVKNIEDGKNVTVKIYKKNQTEQDDYIFRELVEVKEGKLIYEWKTRYYDDLSLLTKDDKLEYIFKLSYCNVESEESPVLSYVFFTDLDIVMDPEKVKWNDTFILKSDDGSYKQEKKVKDDKIPGDNSITLHFDGIKPGLLYTLEFLPESKSNPVPLFIDKKFIDVIKIV